MNSYGSSIEGGFLSFASKNNPNNPAMNQLNPVSISALTLLSSNSLRITWILNLTRHDIIEQSVICITTR
jgi:hypothetical protein